MSWISGNYWLNQTEMENNAMLVWNYFNSKGWTKNAVAAMLGNMQSESKVNPGIWQDLQEYNFQGGFGLVQWTPATNYTDWADQDEAHWNNGDTECDRIIYELENGEQWYGPYSFYEFSQSTASPYQLAMDFLNYYERPADPNQPWRGTQAEEWFRFLGGKHIPKWILFRREWWLKESNATN